MNAQKKEKGALGEDRISDGHGGIARYIATGKRYMCEKGHVTYHVTNHYLEIYTRCKECSYSALTFRAPLQCVENDIEFLASQLEDDDE